MNLGAEAATREPALIHLPDRKYHGGDWILSLPKLTIYNLLLGFSTSFNAACRIALSFPWTWLSLWWDKTREIHCSLFVTHFPLAALAACHNHCSFQGLGEQKRSQQETPRCCQHTPHKTGGETIKPWRRESDPGYALGAISLRLFQEHLVETPWATNGKPGAGFGGLSDSGSLLPSEIPCTGACAPSASLDHTFPAPTDPHGLWKSKSNEPCCTTPNAASKTS